tara:strand:+ start:579 stop:851 length:273 start_codon:yes stop_codon:yes gene_type:complete
MDLDCCSTLNRKDSKKKKIALPDPKKITPASSEKTEHPKIVQCGNILCNMFEFPFDKVNKIARVGNKYHYFCNEFCYYDWLKSPSHVLWL